MESTVIPTEQMTGMHIIIVEYRAARRQTATRTIPAECRAARRWIVTRMILIPAEYRAAHRRIVTRTILIPAEYRAVRRLGITAMEKITKAAEVVEAVEAAGGIIILVMIPVIKAAIIEAQVL